MIEVQKIEDVTLDGLVSRVQQMSQEGYRLVQICATKLSAFELQYSFDKNYEFVSLRLMIDSPDKEIESVSAIYLAAFLYENEIHDLFGLKFKGMAIDYKGNFYRVAKKAAFAEPKKDEKKS